MRDVFGRPHSMHDIVGMTDSEVVARGQQNWLVWEAVYRSEREGHRRCLAAVERGLHDGEARQEQFEAPRNRNPRVPVKVGHRPACDLDMCVDAGRTRDISTDLVASQANTLLDPQDSVVDPDVSVVHFAANCTIRRSFELLIAFQRDQPIAAAGPPTWIHSGLRAGALRHRPAEPLRPGRRQVHANDAVAPGGAFLGRSCEAIEAARDVDALESG